jgi:hypothetical protein
MKIHAPQQTTHNKPQTLSRCVQRMKSYFAPSLLMMDFAAAMPDRNVGSNPLSPAHPPAKNRP